MIKYIVIFIKFAILCEILPNHENEELSVNWLCILFHAWLIQYWVSPLSVPTMTANHLKHAYHFALRAFCRAIHPAENSENWKILGWNNPYFQDSTFITEQHTTKLYAYFTFTLPKGTIVKLSSWNRTSWANCMGMNCYMNALPMPQKCVYGIRVVSLY